ncbi:YdiU family protein [Francisellaceae bacterium]|nr:YdiU family protein [Francisellaceae bacterium]
MTLGINKSKFIQVLPEDKIKENFTREVNNTCFSAVNPLRFPNPKLVVYSSDVSSLLGIDKIQCKSKEFLNIFSGNTTENITAYATCYGGHQFGNWAGQLGDGRAINIGEISHKNKSWEIQLKGAGPTPYSRHADGFAVLRSSVREFLCSEAMHYLGIPSTRALSLMLSGEFVKRDMFYDGHPQMEQGAIVCRVAESFLRFGHFQIHTARNEKDILKKLLDFTIKQYFSYLGEPTKKTYLKWFENVCIKTIDLVVNWMRVGFVHGVLNTDNMSILGLTIDYGPYGWLEGYDPLWTPNTTDADGKRYCYGRQPEIIMWNLAKLAQAIYPLINDSERLELILDEQTNYLNKSLQEMYLSKLGLTTWNTDSERLVRNLLQILQSHETDFTIFFRNISKISELPHSNDDALFNIVKDSFYDIDKMSKYTKRDILSWLNEYDQIIRNDDEADQSRSLNMNKTNPKYILRNYMVQQAIDDAEKNDYTIIYELMDLMKKPYDEQPKYDKYFAKRPEWARNRAGCSMLSCSS